MVRNFQGKPLFPRVLLVVFIYKVCYYDIKEASVLDNFHKETLLNGLVFGPVGKLRGNSRLEKKGGGGRGVPFLRETRDRETSF
jgi:hypothetical protein